jgi:magnesium transporter
MQDKQTVSEAVERQDWATVREAIESWPAADTAELLTDIGAPERAVVFRLTPRERAAEVFACLDGRARDVLLTALTEEETRAIIERMHPDDRTRLLSDLPGRAVQRMLNLLRGEELQQARRLLGYPPESVGRLMTPEYVAVREDWSAGRALEHVRQIGKHMEQLTAVFVVDSGWKLLGVLSLQRLVIADPDAQVGTLIEGGFTALRPEDDRELAFDHMMHYDEIILPVVDPDNILLGIVTADDVFDVAEEEATEDFQLSGAVTPLRGSYRDASILSLCWKRLPWLGSLIFVNLAASGVIAAYEETLASMLALTFFLPLLLGAAGNAGAQASTLTVRALATGDLEPSDWPRAVLKELPVGLVLGGAMAALAWMLARWRADSQVAIVVAFSMATVILVANLVGLTLPFLLSKLKIDPAVASNPLITSVSDVAGVAIYLSAAAFLLAH